MEQKFIYLACDEALLIDSTYNEIYSAHSTYEDACDAIKELAATFLKDCKNGEFREFENGTNIISTHDCIEIHSKDDMYYDSFYVRKIELDPIKQTFDPIQNMVDIVEEYNRAHNYMAPPKFKLGDQVTFLLEGKHQVGSIYIVDPYGTFEQDEEPSYDVMVTNEQYPDGLLVKHLRESTICSAGEN